MVVQREYRVVGALPPVLMPYARYLVRVGAGFEEFITDATGTVAYRQNYPSLTTVALINNAGAVDMDLSLGQVFTFTAQQAAQTIGLSNAPQTATATLALTGADFGTSFALSAAISDNKSHPVAAQSTSMNGLAISTDGTKMFTVGRTTAVIYAYTLSTPGDVSTASYDTVSFFVGGEETAPSSILFSPDGLKLFVTGTVSDRVHQYSLVTPWDLSTASYDNVSLYIGAQDLSPSGLAVSPDGLKLYVSGTQTDRIYQYSLTSAWSLTGASYDSVSLFVGAQSPAPASIVFSDTGLKVFVICGSNAEIYQYNLTTPWSVGTGAYAGISFNVFNPERVPSALCFSADGTKMYLVGLWQTTVYQYSTVGGLAPAVFTYAPAIKWPGGLAPASPAAGETNVIDFLTTDGGTTWLGAERGAAFS